MLKFWGLVNVSLPQETKIVKGFYMLLFAAVGNFAGSDLCNSSSYKRNWRRRSKTWGDQPVTLDPALNLKIFINAALIKCDFSCPAICFNNRSWFSEWTAAGVKLSLFEIPFIPRDWILIDFRRSLALISQPSFQMSSWLYANFRENKSQFSCSKLRKRMPYH